MLIDLVVTTLFVFVYFSNILKNRSHLFTVLQVLTRFPEQKSLQKQLEEMKDTYFQIIHLNVNVSVCEPFSEF